MDPCRGDKEMRVVMGQKVTEVEMRKVRKQNLPMEVWLEPWTPAALPTLSQARG